MIAFAKYRQIYRKALPPNLTRHLVMLHLELPEITQRTGIKFIKVDDDLGDLYLAVVQTTSGKTFGITRHLHSPVPGAIIHSSHYSKNLIEDLTEVLNILKVQRSEVSWINPELRNVLVYVNPAYVGEIAVTPKRPTENYNRDFVAGMLKRKSQVILYKNKRNKVARHTSFSIRVETPWNVATAANLTGSVVE